MVKQEYLPGRVPTVMKADQRGNLVHQIPLSMGMDLGVRPVELNREIDTGNRNLPNRSASNDTTGNNWCVSYRKDAKCFRREPKAPYCAEEDEKDQNALVHREASSLTTSSLAGSSRQRRTHNNKLNRLLPIQCSD